MYSMYKKFNGCLCMNCLCTAAGYFPAAGEPASASQFSANCWPVKNLSGGMLAWLCVCVKVQICIWPNSTQLKSSLIRTLAWTAKRSTLIKRDTGYCSNTAKYELKMYIYKIWQKTHYSAVYPYRMLQSGSHPHIIRNASVRINSVIYVFLL